MRTAGREKEEMAPKSPVNGQLSRVLISCFAINISKGHGYHDQRTQLCYQVKDEQSRRQVQLVPSQKQKKAAETECGRCYCAGPVSTVLHSCCAGGL